MTLPLALTLGEPAGIGPDIALVAWSRRAELRLPPFYILADPKSLERRAQRLGLDVPLETVTPATASAAFPRALPVVPLGLPATAEPGRPDGTSAAAAIASIDRAVADVLGGEACAIVTNPVAKSVLYKAGFADPGHTEYLARLSFQATGDPAWPVMMLWAPEIAVVPVTIHIPFKDVPQRLTRDLIFETGRVVARDLIDRFGIERPRLAVAGLNPHAGEDGTLGKEDNLIVRPAVERLIADGIDARGPLSADTMFHDAARKDLRCRALHVSRPGADPDQDARLRPRRQRDARAALCADLARPRHRLRYRGHRQGRSVESRRSAQIGGAARGGGYAQATEVRCCADMNAHNGAPGSAHDGLPPLRDVIRRHGLSARKSLGQNFLLDLNLTGRIARAAGPLEGVTVVEIGPGPGGLTRALLTEGARRVIAVERDEAGAGSARRDRRALSRPSDGRAGRRHAIRSEAAA